MKGYKVFNPDWSCRGFQYEVGQTYEMAENPKCCSRGFHFCERLVDCFSYYRFDLNNRVAEVEALGDIDTGADGDKVCTNKIKIVRELTWEEVLSMCNTGKGNTGNRNTGNRNTGNRNAGNYNSGYRNSGNFNTGNRNSGYYNSGNYNSGDYNSGNYNSGYYNSGNYNSGDYNSGGWNSGDWNVSYYNAGCFNEEQHTIMLFDQPSNWTYKKWLGSKARKIINACPNACIKRISERDMTDEEKAAHPDYEITGGYLKEIEYTPADKLAWWNSLSEDDRKCIQELPNFDEEKFLRCIGAKERGEYNSINDDSNGSKLIVAYTAEDLLKMFCVREAQYRCKELGLTSEDDIQCLADGLFMRSEEWISGEKICEIIEIIRQTEEI